MDQNRPLFDSPMWFVAYSAGTPLADAVFWLFKGGYEIINPLASTGSKTIFFFSVFSLLCLLLYVALYRLERKFLSLYSAVLWPVLSNVFQILHQHTFAAVPDKWKRRLTLENFLKLQMGVVIFIILGGDAVLDEDHGILAPFFYPERYESWRYLLGFIICVALFGLYRLRERMANPPLDNKSEPAEQDVAAKGSRR